MRDECGDHDCHFSQLVPDSRTTASFQQKNVVAELALGFLHDRDKTLADLEGLAQVNVARLSEVRQMIEAHTLYARGIGLTDAHLIASCLITPGTQLWTSDSRLRSVAEDLGIHVNLS